MRYHFGGGKAVPRLSVFVHKLEISLVSLHSPLMKFGSQNVWNPSVESWLCPIDLARQKIVISNWDTPTLRSSISAPSLGHLRPKPCGEKSCFNLPVVLGMVPSPKSFFLLEKNVPPLDSSKRHTVSFEPRTPTGACEYRCCDVHPSIKYK